MCFFLVNKCPASHSDIQAPYTLLDVILSSAGDIDPSGHLQGVAAGPSSGERDGQSFFSAWKRSRGPRLGSKQRPSAAQPIESWHGGEPGGCRSSAEASGGENWLCLECELQIQGQSWATDTGPSARGLG